MPLAKPRPKLSARIHWMTNSSGWKKRMRSNACCRKSRPGTALAHNVVHETERRINHGKHVGNRARWECGAETAGTDDCVSSILQSEEKAPLGFESAIRAGADFCAMRVVGPGH